MTRLIFSLLRNNKKSTSALFLTIVVTIMLLTAVVPLFTSMQDATEYNLTSKYGLHHAIFFNCSEAQANDLILPHANKLGKIENYGVWLSEKEDNLTLGYLDKDAISLGNITLINGRFPEKGNEITIEENYLPVSSTEALGSFLSLTNNNNSETFEIVGVIKSYSGYWNVPQELISGANDLPNVLTCKRNSVKSYSFMLLSEAFDSSLFYNIAEQIGYTDKVLAINDNSYSSFEIDFRYIQTFKSVFTIIILSCGILAILSSLMLFFSTIKKAYIIVSQLGCEKYRIYTIYIVQCVVIFFAALPTGAFFAFILTRFMGLTGNVSTITLLTSETLFCLLITIFSYMLFANLVFLFHFKFEKRSASLSHYKNIRKWNPNRSPAMNLFNIYSKDSFGSALINMVIIAALTAFLAYICLYLNALAPNNNWGTVDYNLQSLSSEIHVEYNGFQLVKTKKNPYSSNELAYLKNLSQIENVYYTPDVRGAAIIDSKTYDYWYDYVETSQNDPQLQNPKSVPTDVAPVYNYNWFVVTEKNIDALINSYPDIISTDFLEADESILFLPNPFKRKRIHAKEINFGRLEYVDDFEDTVLHHTDKITYKNYILPISTVIDGYFSYTSESYSIENNNPTILINEKTIDSNPLFLGYKAIDVFLYDNISTIEHEYVDSEIKNNAAKSPNHYLYSLADENEKNTYYYMSIYYPGILLIVCVSIFIVFSLYATTSLLIQKRIKQYIIFKAMGLKKTDIFWSIFTEIGINCFAGLLASFLLSYFIIIEKNAYNELPIIAPVYLISLLVISGIIFFLSQQAIHTIEKKSISSFLRLQE